MINVVMNELGLNKVIYRDGFAESTILGAPVILEAVVENDGWVTMIIRSDRQAPIKIVGAFEDFPGHVQGIIENLLSSTKVESKDPGVIERFAKTLDIFSKSLALK